MQIGAEDRNKLIAAVVLTVLAVVLLGRWLFSSEGSSSSAASSPTPAVSAVHTPQPRVRTRNHKPAPSGMVKKSGEDGPALDPTLRYDWLRSSEDTEYKGSGRNIFRADLEIPKPKFVKPKPMPAPAPVVPQGPPPPPPIPLKFFGFASKPGEAKRVFLSQGEDVFVAGEGEIVDRRYKVLRISPTSVEVEDVLNNNRQEIPLSQS